MTSSKGLGSGSCGKVGVVVNILLCNCVCVFVLLGERIPMRLGAPRLKLLFWKKFNPGKSYGTPKHCFIFVTLLSKLSKSLNMGITMCRQGTKVISCLSFRIVYYFVDVCVMCDGI
jgi:hypothetical protein